MSFDDLKAAIEKQSGHEVKVMDLDKLGRYVIDGVKKGDFIIAFDLDRTGELLHRRADEIAQAQLPEAHQLGI
jgi:hypothetical protein